MSIKAFVRLCIAVCLFTAYPVVHAQTADIKNFTESWRYMVNAKTFPVPIRCRADVGLASDFVKEVEKDSWSQRNSR